MSGLYFYYGVMGCSKTAQALITRFNYVENGLGVWLIKPATDTRDGTEILKSRIGLTATASVIAEDDNIIDLWQNKFKIDCNLIICDEAQFFTSAQIEQLKEISNTVDVICYGLKTDFQTKLFPGSKRLLELADHIKEIESVCSCGNKAIVNARIDADGNVTDKGAQIEIGGNERYKPMCWRCWIKAINKNK